MSDISDDMLVYPEDRVVGVVSDPQAIAPLLDALEGAGADRDAVAVYRGHADAERLDPDSEDRSGLDKAIRIVQKAFGDEAERLDTLNDALEAGDLVVTVPLAVDEDDEEAQVEQRGQLGRILQDHGARDVAFYGKWAITQLEPGAT